MEAVEFVQNNPALVTLGITPTRPDTGYGYICYTQDSVEKSHVHAVRAFFEKPNAERARQYCSEGNYLWNAGIFIWKAAHFLQACAQYAPDIYAKVTQHITSGSPEEIQNAYANMPSVPVDVAIMEKANNVYTIPADIGWSDLGTWNSLYTELAPSEHANVTITGPRLLEDTQGCIIRAPEDKLVVIKGLEDYIIIDEDNVLLIYPRHKEQEIKSITAQVRQNIGERYL
jgi:mannose-1-phosphate guanylyltransferase